MEVRKSRLQVRHHIIRLHGRVGPLLGIDALESSRTSSYGLVVATGHLLIHPSLVQVNDGHTWRHTFKVGGPCFNRVRLVRAWSSGNG